MDGCCSKQGSPQKSMLLYVKLGLQWVLREGKAEAAEEAGAEREEEREEETLNEGDFWI